MQGSVAVCRERKSRRLLYVSGTTYALGLMV
jgi:hypothetical protein